MDEVWKPINSVCYTPLSEPYRIYFHICIIVFDVTELIQSLSPFYCIQLQTR
jgi:hypothetical protein